MLVMVALEDFFGQFHAVRPVLSQVSSHKDFDVPFAECTSHAGGVGGQLNAIGTCPEPGEICVSAQW